MQAGTQFREIREGDYDAVVALWQQSEGVEVAEGDDRKGIAAFLRRNPCLSRLALHDGRVVGAVLCGHNAYRGFLYHLAVAQEFRGRSLGKALVEQCVEGLRREGLKRVVILVAKDNPAGREFWEGQQFEEISGATAFGRDL
jgi:ribosomal protein S18 acetylase RimI-like enzyme